MATLRRDEAMVLVACPTCGQTLSLALGVRPPDGDGHAIGEKHGACPKCRHVVGVAIATIKAGRLTDDDVYVPEGWMEDRQPPTHWQA